MLFFGPLPTCVTVVHTPSDGCERTIEVSTLNDGSLETCLFWRNPQGGRESLVVGFRSPNQVMADRVRAGELDAAILEHERHDDW